MRLDENYTLECDAVQCTLYYEKESEDVNPKTGKKTTSKNQWYHKNITDSLTSYINKKVESKEDINEAIATLYSELKNLKENIKNI